MIARGYEQSMGWSCVWGVHTCMNLEKEAIIPPSCSLPLFAGGLRRGVGMVVSGKSYCRAFFAVVSPAIMSRVDLATKPAV